MKGVNSYICSMMCLFCVISFTLDSCDLMTDIQLLLSSCNVLAFLVVIYSAHLFSSLLCFVAGINVLMVICTQWVRAHTPWKSESALQKDAMPKSVVQTMSSMLKTRD